MLMKSYFINNSIIQNCQMNNQNRCCTLHNLPFEYFCQKCYEPTCKSCTMIGPHNTPIHSISTLSSAYERRVHEIKDRIATFLENKEIIMEYVQSLNIDIEQLKNLKQVCSDENERYKRKMLQQLQKTYERITNQIALIKEQFQIKLNQINDIGHTFQHLNDHIEIITSHSSVLQSLKECIDRISILIEQHHVFDQLPKELSDLRLDLQNIQAYKDLIEQKTKVLRQIFTSMDEEKTKIERPNIDFASLLKQLSINIDDCINHQICHYCGQAFTVERANTLCSKNNSSLDINEFVGSCQKKPDASKWATHRHYFAEPAHLYSHFQKRDSNSFSLHLKGLLLKLLTICIIRKLRLIKHFESADKNKTGACNKIEMKYILMEICGLSIAQTQIIITLCSKPTPQAYNYSDLLVQLSKIEQSVNLPENKGEKDDQHIHQGKVQSKQR